jgi:hypothetical protein
VLRFWNHEVLQNIEAVKEVIKEAIPPPLSSPTRGEEVLGGRRALGYHHGKKADD